MTTKEAKMSPETSVARATPKDLKKLLELAWALDFGHRRWFPPLKKRKKVDAAQAKRFKKLLKSRKAIVLLFKVGKRAVAFAVGTIEKRPPVFAEKEYANLERLYVEPKYRQKGIGRALIAQVIAWAKSKGMKTITLQVYEGNNLAKNFYKKQGWKAHTTKMQLPLD